MPREINGLAFLTSQEWMRLGYPVFITAALEKYNEDCAEDKHQHEIITPAIFAAHSPKEQLDFALSYEGIIGYTSYIWEAVNQLRDLEEAKRLIGQLVGGYGKAELSHRDYVIQLIVHGNFPQTKAEQLVSYIVREDEEQANV